MHSVRKSYFQTLKKQKRFKAKRWELNPSVVCSDGLRLGDKGFTRLKEGSGGSKFWLLKVKNLPWEPLLWFTGIKYLRFLSYIDLSYSTYLYINSCITGIKKVKFSMIKVGEDPRSWTEIIIILNRLIKIQSIQILWKCGKNKLLKSRIFMNLSFLSLIKMYNWR